jgi:hypothetical protein
MENLKLVEIPALIDMLAEQTTLYTKMLASRSSHEEFEQCRQRIKEIQQEIQSRKENKGAASLKDQH